MKTKEHECYILGYENGLHGTRYTREEAELNYALHNNYETDLYLLGQDAGLYKRNNGWRVHL